MSEIGLDVGLANDLKLAFRRNNWTLEEVQRAKEGTFLGLVVGVLRGTHEIRPIEHAVDLGALAELPFDGAVLEVHRGAGVVKLERRGDDLYLGSTKIILHRSKRQIGGKVIVGHELRTELEERGRNIPAVVLDYLKKHPELWPEHWKKDENGNTIYIFFWDDIFRHPANGELCVRYGYWGGGQVVSGYYWLDDYWNADSPAASLAS